jgi:uncharacterized protein
VNKRLHCLFAETCSHYVYRIAGESGFVKGIRAFFKRFRQCRPGYFLHKLENGEYVLILRDGYIVNEENISTHLLRGEKAGGNQNIK